MKHQVNVMKSALLLVCVLLPSAFLQPVRVADDCVREDCTCEITDLDEEGVDMAATPPSCFGALIVGYDASSPPSSGCCYSQGEPSPEDNCNAQSCNYRLVISASSAAGQGDCEWRLRGSHSTSVSQTNETFTWSGPGAGSSQTNVSCGDSNSFTLRIGTAEVATITVKCDNCKTSQV